MSRKKGQNHGVEGFELPDNSYHGLPTYTYHDPGTSRDVHPAPSGSSRVGRFTRIDIELAYLLHPAFKKN